MGTRKLIVSPNFFIDFLKESAVQLRTFSVEHPLPADTQLVAVIQRDAVKQVELLLTSARWPETPAVPSPEELFPTPRVTVTYVRELGGGQRG